MKTAIVTRGDDGIKPMMDITMPCIRAYAESMGSDVVILSDPAPFLTSDGRQHYRILKAVELLDTYQRILCLDCDVLLTDKITNIFDEVPYDHIASVYEDKGSRQSNRRELLRNVQAHWENVGWEEGYTNAGFFVLSDIHKGLFDDYRGSYWLDFGSVDLQMGYNAHRHKYNIMELPPKWNNMTMFSEPWLGLNRFESNVIHYAGRGVFDNDLNGRLEQIRRDHDILVSKGRLFGQEKTSE